MWDLDPRRPQKNHGPADDAICWGISGVLVRLTTPYNKKSTETNL